VVKTGNYAIVELQAFIEATRDSGYKSTASAVAELVDNSLDAGGTLVDIKILEPSSSDDRGLKLVVSDNGCGMNPDILQTALQFGGSTRFDSRRRRGRFGMGLPNSSLSQTKRVEVYTWTKPNTVWWSYLDAEEVANGQMAYIPRPRRKKPDPIYGSVRGRHGTIIVWSKCDRLEGNSTNSLGQTLHSHLGKMFREEIWAGKSLIINGKGVQSIDPLFLQDGKNLVGATAYGPPLTYNIRLPDTRKGSETSTVTVRFTELPIEKWHVFSNEEKRHYGISKGGGVSILRGGREIEYGWILMGGKRKENYDDWWRCEVRFEPDLDELFGVTITKQGVRPTRSIADILVPDMERIAHKLNARVRERYLQVKNRSPSMAQRQAESRDPLIEPPARPSVRKLTLTRLKDLNGRNIRGTRKLPGLTYEIKKTVIEDLNFFNPRLSTGKLTLFLNEEHPFYERVYQPLLNLENGKQSLFLQNLEILLLAAARAEVGIRRSKERTVARKIRESWSNILAAFLA